MSGPPNQTSPAIVEKLEARVLLSWPQLEPNLVNAGAYAAFMSGDYTAPELWRTDGTASGTFKLLSGSASKPFRAGGHLFFFRGTPRRARELWSTDGTVAGTHRLLTVAAPSGDWDGPSVRVVGKQVYVGVRQSVWVTDGTLAGTRRVATINKRNVSTAVEFVGALRQSVYFMADDGVHGRELWRTDGTAKGTYLLTDIGRGKADAPLGNFRNSGRYFYFSAIRGTVHDIDIGDFVLKNLWRTDGTKPGTFRVGKLNTITGMHDLNGLLIILTDGPYTGGRLWRSDGTTAGTVPYSGFEARDVSPTRVDDYAYGPSARAGGKFVFSLLPEDVQYNDVVGGNSPVQVTDGFVSKRLFFPNPEHPGEPLRELLQSAELGDTCFFIASYGKYPESKHTGLCRYDGNAGDPTFIRSVPNDAKMLVAGGRLFLTMDGGLWTSDGTDAGTVKLADGGGCIVPAAGGQFFFLGHDPDHGSEPWVTDGTPAGTHLLADIMPGAGGTRLTEPIRFGPGVLFVANDGLHGNELWRWSGDPADAAAPVIAGPRPAHYVIPAAQTDTTIFIDSDGQFLTTTINGENKVISLAEVTSLNVRIELGKGSNRVTIGPGMPGVDIEVEYWETRNSNTLIGGNGNDTISGGPGADWIEGGGGADQLLGGWGNDTLIGGTGRDELFGQQGDDVLDAIDGEQDHVDGGLDSDGGRVDVDDTLVSIEQLLV